MNEEELTRVLDNVGAEVLADAKSNSEGVYQGFVALRYFEESFDTSQTGTVAHADHCLQRTDRHIRPPHPVAR